MMEFIPTRMFSKLIFLLIVFSNIGCRKNSHLKQDDKVVNIITFFTEKYKIPENRNILISEHSLSKYDTIVKVDSSNYVYIHITDYQNDIPYIEHSESRELFKSKIDNYTIYYEINKGDRIRIANNLDWIKIKFSNPIDNLMIIDYTELQCLYNLKTNKLEL